MLQAMKTLTRHILLLFSLFVISCEQELEVFSNDPCAGNDPSIICPPAPIDDCPDDASAGSLDLTKFVAIGNSLGAGYQAGALFTEGQNNSLPRILATQFACAGGSPTFNQPDIESVNGFNSTFSDVSQGIVLGRLVLFTPPGGETLPTPAGTPGVPSPYNTADIPGPYNGDKAQLNNFSVPGILLGQALTPFTGGPMGNPAFNPYYARFASDPGTSTILGDAIAAQGTFYLFSLGMNDVLGYAISGATNEDIFTSAENFATQYAGAFGTLLGALPEAKGVVTNIPDPLLLPYFNMIAWNQVEVDEATAAMLNEGFAGFNAALDGLVANALLSAEDAAVRKVAYAANEKNPILIVDEDLEDLGPKFDILQTAGAITPEQRDSLGMYQQSRPMVPGEHVVLPAALVLGKPAVPNNPASIYGVVVPAGDEYIVTSLEAEVIRERIAAFNQTISTAVAGSNDRYVLADVHGKLMALATTGIDFSGGVVLAPTLEPPAGVFSEDGVHPNNRGYAYLANFVIDAINEAFGATIPHANVGEYGGTGLPLSIQ